MSRKIVSLESLVAMDFDQNEYYGHEYNVTRYIAVGHPYAEPYMSATVESHSDRDVVSIEYARNVAYGNQGTYIVTLKDGHELRLPEYSFIAETVEVKD